MNNYIKSISITYRKVIFFKSVYHSVLERVYKWWDKNTEGRGFPGGTVVENIPANAGDTGSSPALGRSHMLWSN